MVSGARNVWGISMQRRRRRMVVAGTVAAVVAAAVVGVAAFGPSHRAGAQEDYPVPGDGVFTLAGHGFGHGHGMSQYGARGAARSGLTSAQILSFYYPGTTATGVSASSPIRVRLMAASPFVVQGVAGLVFRNLATGATYSVADTHSRYRVLAASDGMHVDASLDGGVTWIPLTFGGASPFAGPLVFQGPPVIKLYFPDGSARDYEGTLTAVRTGTATVASVNTLGLDKYVNGVLPREMPASWEAAALQAQAVAARTYGVSARSSAPAGQAWDICDTTACQVYGGRRLYSSTGQVTDLQPPSSTAAVTATAGLVRSYNGAPIFAQFSASNGGWMAANPGFPYLVAKSDPYDRISNPYANWTLTLSTAELSGCFPAAGTVYRITILTRDGHGDWGGRIVTVRLSGRAADGTLLQQAISGDDLRRCKSSSGFRSTYATVTSTWVTSAAPVGIHEPNGNLDMFARGPRGEGFFRRYLAGQGWQAWQSGGGVILGGPTVYRRSTGSLVVWARGTTNQLYAAGVKDGQWLGWTPKGGTATSRPYPVQLPDGSVDVFYRGGDGALWYGRWATTGAFLGFHSLGGGLAPGIGPAGAVTGTGRITVLVVGTNNSLYTRSYQGGAWGPYRSIGGVTHSDVAAASPAAGVLDIYLRGDTGTLFTRHAVGATWGGWQDAGGGIAAGPWANVLADGTGRTEVWMTGTDGYMYVRVHTSAGAWGGWQRLP